MNATLQIVRKDFRRLRGWLICWIAILLLPIAMGFRLLGQDPLADKHWSAPATLAIITGLEVVVGYILTLLLIHEDRIVGTDQFWLTRPISRCRLLAAKAIGAFAMVGLIPVAVFLPWWLWCGFGIGQIVHAARETVMVLALVVVAGALLASLTDSLARAMLWTLVLAAVALFGMLFFTVLNAARVRTGNDMALVISRSVVAVVVVGVECAAVVVVQFLIRRRGW
jgi:hypothetical protein